MKTSRKIPLPTLKEYYSPDEAKEAIDTLLAVYNDRCRVSFRRTDVEISDSYLIRDARIRRAVCEIIARTGVTNRAAANLSAEWLLHNAAYKAHVKRSSARDVSLDYDRDPRRSVRLGTGLLRLLHLG